MDGNLRGIGDGHAQAEVAIEEFRSGVHFTVQLGQSPVGIADLAVLVAMNMDRVPLNRRILNRGPDSLHKV